MLGEKERSRIKRLRDQAVQPQISYEEFYYHFYKKFKSTGDYAEAYRYAFENVTPIIEEGELIVGKCRNGLSEEERGDWKVLQEFAFQYAPNDCGQNSHMAVDYERVLDLGFEGILGIIEEKLQQTEQAEKRTFYETCRACVEAVIAFSEKYADYAEELSVREEDPERKAELQQIAVVCRHVPRYPARNFYEAMQAVHFASLCISMDPMQHFSMLQFQLGHPDRYLWKYYASDIENGSLTPEYAQLLLDCLGIQINHRVPRGLSSGYMVGGRNKKGELVANELTMLGMNVIDDIRLVYPAVGLCYTPELPDAYLKRACEILSHGCSHPAIFNDDVISSGLRKYGVPEEECHDYIHSTCVEITPVGASNVWVASPYINLVQPLLDSMDREYETMEDLLSAVYQKLDAKIREEFEAQNELRKQRVKRSSFPLLSCLVHDCLERGVDIEKGGARYNWIMPSFVGMSNLMDSLTVIEKLVFEKQTQTIGEIRKMIGCNFEGFELQRLEMLNRIPKYGNDDKEADKWSTMLTEHIVEECKKYTPVFSNARLIPSVFCWIMHAHLGGQTGATPDGRLAGFPLGDGSGPAQGREKNGPTSAILSSTKWEHENFIGGVAVNMKFSKKTFCGDAHEKMLALIKTYLMRGGFEMQINIVDHETLLKARENPEQYQDLVVRIGGYSDYFVKLSPEMQAEVLLRTEFAI